MFKNTCSVCVCPKGLGVFILICCVVFSEDWYCGSREPWEELTIFLYSLL